MTQTLNRTSRRVFNSSELSRAGAPVWAAAEESPIELSRRGGDNLVMMTSEESDARDSLLALAAQLIAAAVSEEGTLAERMADRFDWMLALPGEYREECARDILRAARASFATQQAHLAVAEITSWKSTAEAYAGGFATEPVEWLDEDVTVERPE